MFVSDDARKVYSTEWVEKFVECVFVLLKLLANCVLSFMSENPLSAVNYPWRAYSGVGFPSIISQRPQFIPQQNSFSERWDFFDLKDSLWANRQNCRMWMNFRLRNKGSAKKQHLICALSISKGTLEIPRVPNRHVCSVVLCYF